MANNNNNYSGNQRKASCNGPDLSRNTNELQMSSQLMDTGNGNQNVTNLLLPGSQGTATNSLLSYQSASFSGLYSSPGFNTSLAGYENNLQWLADNRMQNQHSQLPGGLISDKSLNTTTHSLPPTTSHSCCVNRFGVLDSLGMGSPIPTEQNKAACDMQNFQNKSNLTMNMIDPIQSWLNLQIPTQISNTQQYCKYGERAMTQNYNIPVSMQSQMNLPLIDQSDLKQNDMCIQSPDTCFENVNSNGNKQNENNGNSSGLKQNSFSAENKQGMVQDNSAMLKQQSAYQSSLMSKDWKSTFQSMQNYISSPNMFGAINESQENFLFAQYSMPPANSYYPPADNYSFVNKSSACMSQTKTVHNSCEINNAVQNPFIDQSQTKLYNNPQPQNITNRHYLSKHMKETGRMQATLKNHGSTRPLNYDCSLTDCCQVKKTQGKPVSVAENNTFAMNEGNHENKSNGNQNSSPAGNEHQKDKMNYKSSEAVSSESDESNIIVEESDDIGEIESEISIDEIKKSYQANDSCGVEVLLRCLVCNMATSEHTPANNFIHMNESFPLTTSSRTPVRTKLEQILPMDLQHYLKLHNSFMCRRCLNLIETVEVLEVKLTTTKQTISDCFSKTVQHLMPEVNQLLQNNSKVSKSLPAEDGNDIEKSFVELEMTVDNCLDDDIPVLGISDSEATPEFQCPYCSKILSSQKYLDLHIQQHTKEFRFYCERCGKGLPCKSSLEKHLNFHNRAVQMLCELCGDVFSSKHFLYSHQLKNHSKNFDFQCKTCGKGFTRKISLEVHSHKHTSVRPFICEYCGHTYTTETNLKSHIKFCTKDIPHKCDVCGRSFELESQLMRHKSQHNGVFKMNCSVCGKGFNKPSQLNHHMLSHSKEKQFKCSDCDKCFKTMGNLNYHAKVVHKQENLFKCAVCGRIFGQQLLLSDHMNSHTNERPYKCDHCDKSFVHQTSFITHLKTHTDKIKTKTCQVCGKDIKTRMSIHMRTHTGEKPYQCTHCPMAFSVCTSLRKHIYSKH